MNINTSKNDHFIELVKAIKGHSDKKRYFPDNSNFGYSDVLNWYNKHYGYQREHRDSITVIKPISHLLVSYVESLQVVSLYEMLFHHMNPNNGVRTYFSDMPPISEYDQRYYHYKIIYACCIILKQTVPTSHWPNYYDE